MGSSTVTTLFGILLVGFGISLIFSFSYMVKKRGVLSALFWTLIPYRFWLTWASDTQYDDNPEWLDRIQIGLIIAMGALWALGQGKHMNPIPSGCLTYRSTRTLPLRGTVRPSAPLQAAPVNSNR